VDEINTLDKHVLINKQQQGIFWRKDFVACYFIYFLIILIEVSVGTNCPTEQKNILKPCIKLHNGENIFKKVT